MEAGLDGFRNADGREALTPGGDGQNGRDRERERRRETSGQEKCPANEASEDGKGRKRVRGEALTTLAANIFMIRRGLTSIVTAEKWAEECARNELYEEETGASGEFPSRAKCA